MAVISFSEESSDAGWVVAGWAFRQLFEDVMLAHPDDREMAAIFDRAEAVGYFFLDNLNKELAVRVTAAIKKVAAGILAGTIQSGIVDRFHDEQTTQEYLNGLRMLLEAAQAGESHAT